MGYSYDSVGNRITQTNDGLITSLSYLAGSLLHVITAPDGGKTTFSFDVNGNRSSEQSSSGITTYLWQAENVLAGVQLPDGTITTNLYAPNGMRRKTSTGTDSTLFVWDGENILRDLNSDDTQQALYIGAPDDLRYLIGMQRGANSYLAGLDLQGSVNRLLDASNAITDSYLTTAFGQEIASNGSPVNPFQFEGLFGYHREGVNRHLVRFRDLDTATGSFLKLDPMVFFGGENNWYDYVGNNPGNWVDPWGFRPLTKADLAVLHRLVRYGLANDNKGVAQKGLMHAINGAVTAIKSAISAVPATKPDPPNLLAALWAIRNIWNLQYGDNSAFPARGGMVGLAKDTTKCNIFVADAYARGANLGFQSPSNPGGVPWNKWFFSSHKHPYAANDLADPSLSIPHFFVTPSPAVGDIAAFRAPEGIGHATINIGGGALIYASTNHEGGVKVGTVQGVKNWEAGAWPLYRHYR